MRQRQTGFSIMELLIALLLGLVVVAGIVQLFVGNSRTYALVNAQSRLQENARFAFEFMTQAARNAGYYGCAPEANYVIKGLVGSWESIPEYDLSRSVGGFEALGDGNFLPNNLLTLPVSEDDLDLNVHISGHGIDRSALQDTSDIVIFRNIEQPVARLQQVLQADGDPVVYTPDGEPDFRVDDVVVVADCEQAALIKVTGIAEGVNNKTLFHEVSQDGFNFDNGATVSTLAGDILPRTLSVIGRAYGISSVVGRMQTTIFFIAPSVQSNQSGDQIYALWRKQGAEAPVELVQGVENLQIYYGVDTTLDQIPNVNRYQTIDAVNDPASIVAVRIRLDVSSPDNLAETNDRLRRSFSKTISVRNSGV